MSNPFDELEDILNPVPPIIKEIFPGAKIVPELPQNAIVIGGKN